MTRCLLPVGLALVAGCVSNPKTTLLQPTPANGQVVQVAQAAPEATQAVAVRAATLGRKIAEANPQMGLQTIVSCLGVPQPTIFHRLAKDSCQIYISEGLVNQCPGEAQLAAVLCMEMGKAASEKAAAAAPPAPRMYIEPPPACPVGTDSGGPLGSPDLTRLAELGKVDQERHRHELPPPPPAADVLARAYLQRAGYAAADLQAVTPLLRAAEKNTEVEKQILGKLHG
jgi:hypothetical protein